jgi:hypothetical protein
MIVGPLRGSTMSCGSTLRLVDGVYGCARCNTTLGPVVQVVAMDERDARPRAQLALNTTKLMLNPTWPETVLQRDTCNKAKLSPATIRS